MKAIVCRNYGPPDVLTCEEIATPTPGDDEVLIRVKAASVNPVDRLFEGTSYPVRLMTGLRKPKDIRVGTDVAGQAEAVGRNVTQFKPGDEVFGACHGAFAEYARTPESKLAMKPANVTFEAAAAVPVAAITALQGLRDKGRIQPGQKVLINGAAGGVGTFAVQIAKSFGAQVTGVCSARNVDLLRSIGADQVIDYTREDFTQSGQQYDLIFDCVGTRSVSACRRVMTPKGIYIIIGGPAGRWIGPLAPSLRALLVSPFVSQTLAMFTASINQEDLIVLKELIEAKKLTPVIDRCYTLSDIRAAIRYLEEGHARGKVVIPWEHH